MNIAPLQYMAKYKVITAEKLQQTIQFLEQLPLNNVYYSMSYDISNEKFSYEDTINLIDQLYIVLHLERANISTNEFFQWINNTFYSENKIYGRYNAESKEHAVEYESAAVRSEERRVGKECRGRWWESQQEKKQGE